MSRGYWNICYSEKIKKGISRFINAETHPSINFLIVFRTTNQMKMTSVLQLVADLHKPPRFCLFLMSSLPCRQGDNRGKKDFRQLARWIISHVVVTTLTLVIKFRLGDLKMRLWGHKLLFFRAWMEKFNHFSLRWLIHVLSEHSTSSLLSAIKR